MRLLEIGATNIAWELRCRNLLGRGSNAEFRNVLRTTWQTNLATPILLATILAHLIGKRA